MSIDIFLEDIARLSEVDFVQLQNFLSDEEKSYIDNYHHQQARHTFIVTRAKLRQELCKRINNKSLKEKLLPHQLEILTTENGKPFINDIHNLHFNASHTQNWIAYAISEKPLGIDIELKNRDVDVERLQKRNCHPVEIEQLDSLSVNQKDELFMKIWTLKEAWIKSMGEKISSVPLNKFGFKLDQERAELINQTEKPCSQKFWSTEHSDLFISLAFENTISEDSIQLHT